MFLVIFVSFSWFAHNQLITGCKRELPPTKQEIANPYIYKVTDNRYVHYGLHEHFFKFLLGFFATKITLQPKMRMYPLLGAESPIKQESVERSRAALAVGSMRAALKAQAV
jgi:hypothetical protein